MIGSSSACPLALGADLDFYNFIWLYEETLKFPVRNIHKAILQVRCHDLENLFDLSKNAGVQDFLGWCVTNGVREYAALAGNNKFIEDLSEPACTSETEWSGGISKQHVLLGIARRDLGLGSLLDDASEQLKFLSWFWFGGGFLESPISSSAIPPWQKSYWIDSDEIASSRFSKLLLIARPDIAKHFSLNDESGRQRFRSWLNSGVREKFLYDLPCQCLSDQTRKFSDTPKFGVNLIGYAKGDLGIGEDVRMTAAALAAAGIPFVILDFSPGGNVSETNLSVEKWISENPVYLFNVICLTAMEHLRFYLEKGHSYFQGRYTIGYWPWELEEWPSEWNDCFNLVDEIWSSSSHTYNSIQKTFRGKAKCLPMAVEIPNIKSSREKIRLKNSLPVEGYIFVFSFDGNSTVARKNPLAIVLSFKLAFPSAEGVYLLIKGMRMGSDNKEWRKIEEIAALDSRILIKNETYSHYEIMELYSACNCFVSLHRAEGFGRGIAEAFLLGLQVIATDYGGNTDFCRELCSASVSYKKVQIGPNEYIGSGNQQWAEPSVLDASDRMREAVNREHQQDKQVATNSLEKLFSPKYVGQAYFQRLDLIFNDLGFSNEQ